LKPTRVTSVLESLMSTRWPVFIWGPPGVGKSSVVSDIAKTGKLNLIDVRASLLDPTDIRGIPYIKEDKAKWSPPSFLPNDPKSEGVLFFDELNAAPPLVQASLYQLTLDRKVGEYCLPDGWRIIAAGNRAEDASIVFRMPAALTNRFIHLDFEVDVDDWIAWAIDHQIHPLVIGFIRTRRELLFDMRNIERAFPTPRSWEILSDTLGSLGSPKEAADVLIGVVGEGAAMEFLGFCDTAISEDLIKGIIKDPEKAKLPTELGNTYALISYLSSRSKEAVVMKAAANLLGRLNPEMAVLLIRDIIRVNPKIISEQGYLNFVEKHSDLLT
jgi:hypothetical protein